MPFELAAVLCAAQVPLSRVVAGEAAALPGLGDAGVPASSTAAASSRKEHLLGLPCCTTSSEQP